MKKMEKILIGGQALRELGHDRHTEDVDYLIYDNNMELFVTSDNIDYINAAQHPMFREIWEAEKGNDIASPQALAEMKAYAFVQHCQNFNFSKADACEYDLRFLKRKFNATPKLVKSYVSEGEYNEIIKSI